MPGAPMGNDNAAGHGLYRAKPARHVRVLPGVGRAEMAEYARDLSAGALWIAEALAGSLDPMVEHKDRKLIGLYASVAQELAQVAAELEGATGIKPAPLGGLTEEGFERLMAQEAKALELILNQCISAWKHIQDREEIEKDGLLRRGEDGWETNPVLGYLAAAMRSAKRIIARDGSEPRVEAVGN